MFNVECFRFPGFRFPLFPDAPITFALIGVIRVKVFPLFLGWKNPCLSAVVHTVYKILILRRWALNVES